MSRYTIGGLARRTGCKVETIRYYERIALVPAPPRSAGGHRLFDDSHVSRLRFIRRSRGLGFTLDEIRELLSLVDDGTIVCDAVKEITLAHAAEVRRKIADLIEMESTLNDLAAGCRGDQAPDCAIIAGLFAAATNKFL